MDNDSKSAADTREERRLMMRGLEVVAFELEFPAVMVGRETSVD